MRSTLFVYSVSLVALSWLALFGAASVGAAGVAALVSPGMASGR